MKYPNTELARQLKQLSNKQIKQYASVIRKLLINQGLDKAIVDSIIKKAVVEFQRTNTFDTKVSALLGGDNYNDNLREKRGIDAIGRILVEYCFIRTPQTKMVWPEDSELDKESRKRFVEGIIPRPLMHTFLISVRGTLPELDAFEAGSVLFGEENKNHEERREYVNSLVRSFQKKDGAHKQLWDEIYSDKRFQKVALDLIGDIRRKIVQFGLKRFLRILENLRQRDPKGRHVMSRPYKLEDVKQLDDALWNAEEKLSEDIEK